MFYGRGAIRQNLFEEAELAAANREPCSTIVTRSSQQHQQQQQHIDNQRNMTKNRQGRKLIQKSIACCYVANTLLNVSENMENIYSSFKVNNERPLSPVIPKSLANKLNSPFKLQRMLRLPSRARRRRQQKQRSNESIDRTESTITASAINNDASTIDDKSKLDGLFIHVASNRKYSSSSGSDKCLMPMQSPRTNGRLRSAENVVDQMTTRMIATMSPTTTQRPRSMSIGEFPTTAPLLSPTTRHSARLLTAIAEESSSSTTVSSLFDSEMSSSSSSTIAGHLADTENTLSADDVVFQLVHTKMNNSTGAIAQNGFTS